MLKKCAKCKKVLPEESFYRRFTTKNELRSWCKSCDNKSSNAWAAKNRERRNKTTYAWRSRNPRKVKQINLKCRYGISIKMYDDLLLSQGGACKICRKVPDGKNLFVDHNHVTGEVRGLLCSKCNSALGFLGEDPEIVKRLSEYVNGRSNEEDPQGMALPTS